MSSFIKMSFCLLFIIVVAGNLTIVIGQTPKASEVIAKHLDAIGTEKNRKAVETRLTGGTSVSQSKLPPRTVDGTAVIVSEGTNLYFMSSFSAKDYPYEKIGYFNNKVSIPVVSEGVRSPLGSFINAYTKILSEGLLTGSISNTWFLLHPEKITGNFDNVSKGKIDGRDVYSFQYYPKGIGTEFGIKLFFDAKTYHHVRTEYRHVQSHREEKAGIMGNNMSGMKQVMIEDFGDHKDAGGLVLPHSYKINYITDSSRGTWEYDWLFNLQGYTFNKNFAPTFFTFEEKK